jgi:hypothetical protein
MSLWASLRTNGCQTVLTDLVRLYGDSAGRLLSQVLYWHTPDAHGKPRMWFKDQDETLWASFSAQEWQDQTGLTRWKFYRAMDLLEEQGVIYRASMHRNRLKTTCLRLNQEELERQLIAGELNEAQAALAKFANLKMQKQESTLCLSNIETGLEINPCGPSAPLGQGSLTPDQGQGTPLVKTGNFETPEMEEIQTEETSKFLAEAETSAVKIGSHASLDLPQGPVEKKMSSAKEVLGLLNSKKNEKSDAVSGIGGLALLWKKRMSDHTPEFVKPLSGKETGQLRNVLKAVGPELATEAVEFVMANWSAFCWEIKTSKADKRTFSIPDPGYFSYHYEVALQLIAKKKSPPTPPGSPKKKETCTMPVTSAPAAPAAEVDTSPPETDLAKQQAVMDQLAAILKSKG